MNRAFRDPFSSDPAESILPALDRQIAGAIAATGFPCVDPELTSAFAAVAAMRG